MKKLLLVTDAWHPQVNGVVRSFEQMKTRLERRGFEVRVVHPGLCASVPLPLYNEIRLALFPRRVVRRTLEEFAPDYIHIAAEGPLGLAARSLCMRRGLRFTTSYHTHFQLYVHVRFHKFLGFVYGLLSWFHKTAARTMVATKSIESALEAHNFKHLALWPLGVDGEAFARNAEPPLKRPVGPVFIYFGRLAPEKGVEEFLRLELPGTKLVVGDGPDRPMFEKKYASENTHFVGYKYGQELVDYLSLADVFVFPSRTETFGLVVLEALACGIPVAAHDVMGPRDIVTHGKDGYLSDDLREAALACLNLSRVDCRAKALQYSWEASADAFVANLVPVKERAPA